MREPTPMEIRRINPVQRWWGEGDDKGGAGKIGRATALRGLAFLVRVLAVRHGAPLRIDVL